MGFHDKFDKVLIRGWEVDTTREGYFGGCVQEVGYSFAKKGRIVGRSRVWHLAMAAAD
jgi:hypothetical protein